jgi:alpha-beta hydrolase superfamily lysophospholipase
MVIKQHMQFLSNDHITFIHGVKWIPEGEVKAILQISHGMCEYVERYDDFAEYLAEQGILVVGNDHLGHGESVRTQEDRGYFAKENGNSVLVRDIHRLRRMIQEEYPDVPYFLMGHSMGSFLARQYICCYGRGLAGVIIMGTGDMRGSRMKFGMQLCKSMAKVQGWHARSKFMDTMTMGGYRKKFRGTGSGESWQTKDKAMLERYKDDERCNFRFTLNGYYNLYLSIYKLDQEKYLQKMPKKIPVLFVSGGDDPVGDGGKGVLRVYKRFKKLGMRHVKCRIYPGDRHNILFETDRDKVYKDLYTWMLEGIEKHKTKEDHIS